MLLDLPNEILYNIALFLFCSSSSSSTSTKNDSDFVLGPPTSLPPLLLTHRKLYHLLSPNENPYLWIWKEVYQSRFDSGASLRRSSQGVTSSSLSLRLKDEKGWERKLEEEKRREKFRWLNQLENNCRAMRFFRRGDYWGDRTEDCWPSPLTYFPSPPSTSFPYHPHPNPIINLLYSTSLNTGELSYDEALLTGYTLILEDDGKNARQLVEWGRAREWCLGFMERRWVESGESPEDEEAGDGEEEGEEDGWTRENLRNCLVVGMFWGLCDRDTLVSLPSQKLHHMKRLLSPIIHNPYRYPASEFPPQYFTLPLSSRTRTRSRAIGAGTGTGTGTGTGITQGAPQGAATTAGDPPLFAPAGPTDSEAAVPPTDFPLAPASTGAPHTPTTLTPHGPYPPLPPSPLSRRHTFSHYTSPLPLSFPLLSSSSKLLYFALSELLQPTFKPSLPDGSRNRTEWFRKKDRREYTRNVEGTGGNGWEMGYAEYMREWRRRGEWGSCWDDVDEVNWGWVARPPVRSDSSISFTSTSTSFESSTSAWGGERFGLGSFLEDINEEETGIEKKLKYANEVDKTIIPRWRGKAPSSLTSIPKSITYDAEYWRLRLCSSGAGGGRSVGGSVGKGIGGGGVRPGRVYEVGSMAGCWVGKMTFPFIHSLQPLLTSATLSHQLTYSPLIDPLTNLPVLDPETGEPVPDKTKITGVKMSPEMEAPLMPVVMRLWEGHLLTGMVESVAGAGAGAGTQAGGTSRNTAATAKNDQDGDEGEDEDPFWTSVRQETNPNRNLGEIGKDNMLNAWFPGFPGTTKVSMVSSSSSTTSFSSTSSAAYASSSAAAARGRAVRGGGKVVGDDQEEDDEVEVEMEDWDGRKRRVRCRVWNGGSRGGLHGNDALSLPSPHHHHHPHDPEGKEDDDASCYHHTLPLPEEDDDGTKVIIEEGTWTGHGYAHLPSGCRECRARMAVDRQLEEEERRERERERMVVEEERMDVDMEAEVEKAFRSVGLGGDDDDDGKSGFDTGSSPGSSEQGEEDDEDDEEEDDDDGTEGEEEEEEKVQEEEDPNTRSIPLTKFGTPFRGAGVDVEVVPKGSRLKNRTQTFKAATTTSSSSSKRRTTTITSSSSSKRRTKTITSPSQGCSGINQTILFGTSGEERHGDAWGRYRYYGRVRKWDGLVGLVRVPVRGRGPRFDVPDSTAGGAPGPGPGSASSGSGSTATSSTNVTQGRNDINTNVHPYSTFLSTHIDARTALLEGSLLEEEDDGDRGMVLFYGYVGNGGESFVGSWRSVGMGDVKDPGWEGSFVFGRRSD